MTHETFGRVSATGLIADTFNDLSDLLRKEMRLASAEMSHSVSASIRATVMMAVGGAFLLMALLFALAAERLSAFYEHGQWMTEAQGATLAAQWLSRSKTRWDLKERRLVSDLSDQFARRIAGELSREAGLFTAHEMMEALDPNHFSELTPSLLDECERLLREHGVTE